MAYGADKLEKIANMVIGFLFFLLVIEILTALTLLLAAISE